MDTQARARVVQAITGIVIDAGLVVGLLTLTSLTARQLLMAWAAVFLYSSVRGGLVHLVGRWLDGWYGLDQWPNPHGRYYDRWLKLPEGAGDYYAWLSRQMGKREPWATWARLERTQGDL